MTDDSRDIEKLYEYGEKLNEAKDKSQVSNFFLSDSGVSALFRSFFFFFFFMTCSILGAE